jgi:hypothetical protein
MNTIHSGRSTDGKAAIQYRLNYKLFSKIRKREQYSIIFCRLPSRLARRRNFRSVGSPAVIL